MTEQLNQPEIIDQTNEDITHDEADIAVNLFGIEFSVVENDVVPQDIKKFKDVVGNIMQDPPNPPEEPEQEKIGDLLKKGKIADALTEAVNLVSSILFGTKKKAGLDDFKKYEITPEEMNKLSINKINQHIRWIDHKIRKPGLSTTQKLRFSYLLSRFKDAKVQREKPDITPFESLAKNIKVGDVLLMNKDSKESGLKSKIANNGLQITSKSIRTHTVIVTKVSGNNIEITHGTIPVVKKEESLQSYLSNYNAVDVCVLQADLNKNSRKTLVHYAYGLLGKSYDEKSAAKQALLGKNSADDCYNCGEVVADSLLAANPVKFKDLKNKTFPSDFLLNNYILPSYMTTIYRKDYTCTKN